MDRTVLYYVILFIWLVPFAFGARERARTASNLLHTCLDGLNHKSEPGEESELFSQCTPWKRRSCCTDSTARKLHENMHYNFNYNHCSNVKNMSSECMRHFVQDTCFYECSPNVGPWLVKVNMKVRKERFFKVPLCYADCKAWYDACKHDYTCGVNWIKDFEWSKTGNKCRKESSCHTFERMYQTPENFCEKVWDHSWKVTADGEPCMRLWFDGDEGNPNDAVARYHVERLMAQNSAMYHSSGNLIIKIFLLTLSLSILFPSSLVNLN